MKAIFIISVLILNVYQCCQCVLTHTKENIIESLTNELYIKYFNIIKDSEFPTDHKIFSLVKKLSQKKIFTCLLSAAQMENLMLEHYNTYFEEKENLSSIKVFPPKTMVWVTEKKLGDTLKILLKVQNEFIASKYTWLVLKDMEKDLIRSPEIYIPYNCQFLTIKNSASENDSYIVGEMYYPSLKRLDIFNRHFGTWKINQGLEIIESDFYKRRIDLNGTILYAEYYEDDEAPYIATEMFQEFSRIMNFKYIALEASEFNKPPYPNAEILLLKKILYGLPRKHHWLVWPFWSESYHFYIKKEEKYEQHDISPFLRPFSFNLWLTVASWLATSTICIILIYHITKKILKLTSGQGIIFSDCLYESLETFLNQCGSKIIINCSHRIVKTSIKLTALFIIPSYTGAILSYILFPALKLPFTNVKEFAEIETFKLVYEEASNLQKVFLASNDPSSRKIGENLSVLLVGPSFDAYYNGINKMCNDHDFSFVATTSLERDILNCKILKIPTPIFSGWIGIELRHSSPYEKMFNRILRSFRSSGILQKNKFNINEEDDDNNNNSVKLKSFVPIFKIMGVLHAISVLILFTEISFNYFINFF